MTDTEELVKRIKSLPDGEGIEITDSGISRGVCDSEELKALVAELEAAERDESVSNRRNESLEGQLAQAEGYVTELQAELAAAAERERALREALERILGLSGVESTIKSDDKAWLLGTICGEASKALNGGAAG